VSFEELHQIMGMHEVEDLEARFLTDEQRAAKYGRGGDTAVVPQAPRAEPVEAAKL